MGEREQLLTQWATLSVAQRETLFRAWVLSETVGFAPASLVFTGVSAVTYGIAAGVISWQVAIPQSFFSSAQPDQAVEAGDTVIEIGHLVAELRETTDEMSEFEQEDESVEGDAAAIIPGIIDALEQERMALEDALLDDDLDPDEAEEIEDLIEAIEALIEEMQKELEDLGVSA